MIQKETEKDVEEFLREKMKKVGGLSWKFNSPNVRGVPDRICIFPGGLVIFAEIKEPNGRLSKLQEYRIKQLGKLETPVVVLKSKREVEEFVEVYST